MIETSPTDQALVSIVMPMFNSAAYLESTVASVLQQTFRAWELLLFDDGSTDQTPAIARALAATDSRIKTATGRHEGVGAARNDGLRRTTPTTEYVVFLDSDDTWTPDALETLVAALDAHPDAPAAHALARGTDIEGRPNPGDDLEELMRNRSEWYDGRTIDVRDPSRTTFAAMIVKNWIETPGTSIIRRSALASIGELDPATSPADDWDLNIRLSRLGDLVFVDQTILNWRRHSDSLANTSKRWRRACFEVRVRTVRDPTNTSEQRSLALSLLAADCRRSRRNTLRALSSHSYRMFAAEVTFGTLSHLRYLQFRFARSTHRRAPTPRR